MTFRKIIFLFLALLLPAAVFVFLKLFGRNEFHVPVLLEQGNVAAPANCDFPYTTPYRVPDSVFTTLDKNQGDSLYVFYFDLSLNTAMDRVTVEFGDAPVQLVSPSRLPENTNVRVLKECVLLMEPGISVALVDHRNRIRGYYDGSDRDEVDRLIVEMKIILKQY